ncbi:MAG: YCF48-related protein, partial [Bacteroidota bacterium]
MFLFGSALGVATSNGWRALSPPTTRNLTKVFFLDSLRGWVVGRQGTILRTVDGGRTWESQDPGLEADIVSILMLSNRRGWALSFVPFIDTTTWYGTRILKTTNGGDTWTSQQFPIVGKFLSSIVFLDSTHGWMGGANGDLYRTTNGGANWIPANVDSSLYARLAIVRLRFFSPSFGLAVGGRIDLAGAVWRTTDGGEHWTTQGVSSEPIYDLHFIDSLNIIAVGGDLEYGASIIRTEDGGQQWEYSYLGVFGQPAALSFRTSAEGWAPLGFAGAFIYTLDTGKTWTALDTPGRRAIYDLMFVDSTTGYAVGEFGTILKFNPATVSVDEASILPLMPELRQN